MAAPLLLEGLGMVALLTLVLFGLTLPAVIRAVRLEAPDAEDRSDAMHALLRQVGETAVDTLGPLEEQTIDGEPVDPQVARSIRDRLLPRLLAGVREQRDARAEALDQTLVLQRRYLDAMRDALASERRIGAYSSQTYRQLESLLGGLEHRFRPGA